MDAKYSPGWPIPSALVEPMLWYGAHRSFQIQRFLNGTRIHGRGGEEVRSHAPGLYTLALRVGLRLCRRGFLEEGKSGWYRTTAKGLRVIHHRDDRRLGRAG